jgi:hypothetical protein
MGIDKQCQIHALFTRKTRNVVVTDEVLDGENSLIEQANNRTYAAIGFTKY